jgi:hypothetical protein
MGSVFPTYIFTRLAGAVAEKRNAALSILLASIALKIQRSVPVELNPM